MKNTADFAQSLIKIRALAAFFVTILCFPLVRALFSMEVDTDEVD